MHRLQDEMLALQRINSYTFLVGYLGFLATWILDTVYSLLHRTGVKATDDAIKNTLRAISPHYALARFGRSSILHCIFHLCDWAQRLEPPWYQRILLKDA